MKVYIRRGGREVALRCLPDRSILARRRLLNLIADRETCVWYFVEILGMTDTKATIIESFLKHAAWCRSNSTISRLRW